MKAELRLNLDNALSTHGRHCLLLWIPLFKCPSEFPDLLCTDSYVLSIRK